MSNTGEGVTVVQNATLACGVILVALAIAIPNVRTQSPPPPPLLSGVSTPSNPQRNISAEMGQMTKQYGLTEYQGKKVRAGLEDHAAKAEAFAEGESPAPRRAD